MVVVVSSVDETNYRLTFWIGTQHYYLDRGRWHSMRAGAAATKFTAFEVVVVE